MSNKKIDKWGCWNDYIMELIDEARRESHLKDHIEYPQSWCVWCEEEKEEENELQD